jgi:hypothetical protein
VLTPPQSHFKVLHKSKEEGNFPMNYIDALWQIRTHSMSHNPPSPLELCAACRHLFNQWQKVQRLGCRSFNTTYVFAEVLQSEMRGCGLCAAILNELSSNALDSLKGGKYIRSLPISVYRNPHLPGQLDMGDRLKLRIDFTRLEKAEICVFHSTGTSKYGVKMILADVLRIG